MGKGGLDGPPFFMDMRRMKYCAALAAAITIGNTNVLDVLFEILSGPMLHLWANSPPIYISSLDLTYPCFIEFEEAYRNIIYVE